jgi:hypothetical protein
VIDKKSGRDVSVLQGAILFSIEKYKECTDRMKILAVDNKGNQEPKHSLLFVVPIVTFTAIAILFSTVFYIAIVPFLISVSREE